MVPWGVSSSSSSMKSSSVVRKNASTTTTTTAGEAGGFTTKQQQHRRGVGSNISWVTSIATGVLLYCVVSVYSNLYNVTMNETFGGTTMRRTTDGTFSSSFSSCDGGHGPPLENNNNNNMKKKNGLISSSSSVEGEEGGLVPPPYRNGKVRKPIPIVIICALRPHYLKRLLESLQLQSIITPTTPKWISESPRYLFIHLHERNADTDKFQQVMDLADQYKFSVHVFGGLHTPLAALNLNANFAWYKMMRYLFRKNTTHLLLDDNDNNEDDENNNGNDNNNGNGEIGYPQYYDNGSALQEEEALILEEDIVLAPDALLMTSAMLQEKWNRNDVHNVILGGWSGINRINPNPYTFLAVRSQFFQAMGYTMSRTLFEKLERAKQDRYLYHRRGKYEIRHVNDWTEEITIFGYLQNVTQLTPSVGRMTHIGARGMGEDGRGTRVRQDIPDTPWRYWNTTIWGTNGTEEDTTNSTTTTTTTLNTATTTATTSTEATTTTTTTTRTTKFHLEPTKVTDMFGFICSPIMYNCYDPPKELLIAVREGIPVYVNASINPNPPYIPPPPPPTNKTNTKAAATAAGTTSGGGGRIQKNKHNINATTGTTRGKGKNTTTTSDGVPSLYRREEFYDNNGSNNNTTTTNATTKRQRYVVDRSLMDEES